MNAVTEVVEIGEQLLKGRKVIEPRLYENGLPIHGQQHLKTSVDVADDSVSAIHDPCSAVEALQLSLIYDFVINGL